MQYIIYLASPISADPSDFGLGIRDWGLGIGDVIVPQMIQNQATGNREQGGNREHANPRSRNSPIPNPQTFQSIM